MIGLIGLIGVITGFMIRSICDERARRKAARLHAVERRLKASIG